MGPRSGARACAARGFRRRARIGCCGAVLLVADVARQCSWMGYATRRC